ncbi:MAG: tRNA (guanosine(37)-N1)-methyltransferase TrmD [Firmicutes bacterium]|nr:tRNA (guanosine(37)-N1)-methyltransferase TrmD [Bacillota bacterium]
MHIDIVTIFPEMFNGPFQESMIKRALDKDLVSINVVDLRDHAGGKHRQVDDYPYGGGRGMVLKPEPLFAAVRELGNRGKGAPYVILLSPRGKVFDQGIAAGLAAREHLILLCGHYEGVDERVRRYLVHEEISIGDYILTGGEIPAMAVTDAVVRLLPGVLSDDAVKDESFTFAGGLLEYPQYTRPPIFEGYPVPDVLLSGNHGLIKEWRHRQAMDATRKRRPDLLDGNGDISGEEGKGLE